MSNSNFHYLRDTSRWTEYFHFIFSQVFPLETQRMFAKLLLDYFSAVRLSFKSKERFVMDLIKRNYSILTVSFLFEI